MYVDDGLPCIDFEMDENDKKCKCDGGIKAITTIYGGERMAERVMFYVGDDTLCIFYNVLSNDTITCSVKHSKYKVFEKKTKVVVRFNDGLECEGSFDTSCDTNLYNALLNECGNLQVVGWEDKNGYVCG